MERNINIPNIFPGATRVSEQAFDHGGKILRIEGGTPAFPFIDELATNGHGDFGGHILYRRNPDGAGEVRLIIEFELWESLSQGTKQDIGKLIDTVIRSSGVKIRPNRSNGMTSKHHCGCGGEHDDWRAQVTECLCRGQLGDKFKRDAHADGFQVLHFQWEKGEDAHAEDPTAPEIDVSIDAMD